MEAGVATRVVAVLAAGRKLSDDVLVDGLRALGFEAAIVTPAEALADLEEDAVAVVRLDVLPTLDGVEPGLAEVRELEALGRRVVNGAEALLAAHDKLLTAGLLAGAGIPHPPTAHVSSADAPLPLEPPLVVKPRFGSWGRDVLRCVSEDEARRCLAHVSSRSWFRTGGALVQELVPWERSDLRVIVAGGRVVGAAERVAAPGEWRTNVSLGGLLVPAEPPPEACRLSLAAAEAIGAGLVGVDLLRRPDGGWTVLELNGSVDFDRRYSLGGRDVYAALVEALGLAAA